MKKGFTLIEMVAIIIILALISLIVYPVISNIINDNKDELYERQMGELLRLSNAWVAGNAIDLEPREGFSYNLSFDELGQDGYVIDKDIINPKTGEKFKGCMVITYNSIDSDFDVVYDSDCIISDIAQTPSINLTVADGIINSSGYATKDFDVNVVGVNITSYKYCKGTSECEPTITVTGNSGSVPINTDGITYVCVIGRNKSKNTDKLCKSYKLDKTELVMGTLIVDGTKGLDDWYVSDVNLSVKDVSGVTSTLNISKIDYDTKGAEVIMTSTTKGGKVGTKTYTIKVDKTKPTAGTLNIIGTKGNNDWYLSDVIFNVIDGSDEISGHKITTSTHTSITSNTNGTNVVVTTMDNAGNQATRTYSIKVNKNEPVEGTLIVDGKLGNNNWYVSDVNLSVRDVSGVTSTLNIYKIDYDTTGTEVIMTSTNDITGLSKTTKYTIKVDKTKPIAGLLTIDGVKGENGWYISDVNIKLGDGTDSTSGIYTNNVNVTSITNETNGTSVIVTTTDNAGNISTTEQIIKIDKTKPTPGTLNVIGEKGTNDWYVSDLSFTINDGSDSLSGHASTTSNISSITSNTDSKIVTITTKDMAGNTATKDYTFKVDKNAPTITPKYTTVTIGSISETDVSDLFTTTYSISSGSVSCNVSKTANIKGVNNPLSCTATGGNGLKSTATIAVKNPLVSIAVITPPTKTIYKVGESFDKTGMVVRATYKDGTTKNVTGYTTTMSTSYYDGRSNRMSSPYGINNLKPGTNQTITIAYTEDGVRKTTTTKINTYIYADQIVNLTVSPSSYRVVQITSYNPPSVDESTSSYIYQKSNDYGYFTTGTDYIQTTTTKIAKSLELTYYFYIKLTDGSYWYIKNYEKDVSYSLTIAQTGSQSGQSILTAAYSGFQFSNINQTLTSTNFDSYQLIGGGVSSGTLVMKHRFYNFKVNNTTKPIVVESDF